MPAGKQGLMHQPGVIEVASSESHSGIRPALYAPGREILTLLPGGHYDFASGDSISTAQVTRRRGFVAGKESCVIGHVGTPALAQYQRSFRRRRRR